MKHILTLALLLLSATVFPLPAQTPSASLHGVVTDPSGALVPGAMVQLRGPGREQRQLTGPQGEYSFPALAPGKYTVRFIAKGFTVNQKPNVEIAGAATLDAQLSIAGEAQVINVEDEANKVSVDPNSNGGALILGQKELDALSDDPDELQQQLQAMAGPGAGPNGGQIYVDGFSNGQLPPKASILQIRINANPFSPEYDRPGFGRIEITTRPGTDSYHGAVFGNYNKEALNSRSPLLTEAKRPQYKQEMFGFSLNGPIKKSKASFGFEGFHRNIVDDAFVLATTLDSNFNPLQINQAIQTPQTVTTLSPRVDYSFNAKHNLTVRYQNTRFDRQNQGVGDFNLASRAYDGTGSTQSVQATETAILSPRLVSETRFQYLRNANSNTGDNTIPTITVAGAFSGGGAQIGNSGSTNQNLEFSNIWTFTRKTHTFRFGGRLRQSFFDSTSVNNFGGTFTFQSGTGPALDGNNQPIPGTSIGLTGLEVYRRTLIFQKAGLSDSDIRLLGGGAYQFGLSAGKPTTTVHQFDAGLFFLDDWRARPNITFSYGLRYEAQTNISDHANFAPRVAIAWGIHQKGNTPAKTVVRAGIGAFYDRVADSTILQALRFNGVTQQSFVVFAPSFFPAIPPVATLQAGKLPQQIQTIDRGIEAPRTYQLSMGADRQINKYVRVSGNYIETRGVHLQRSRDINAPLGGLFPFGDPQIRMLTEATGFSRSHQFSVLPSINYKKWFLAGYYNLSYGKSDAEGQPADPYNLRAEWGPSAFTDIRHRAILMPNIPMPKQIVINPIFMVSSGTPYNISIGRDLNGDTINAERPSLATGVAAANCAGNTLKYEPGFGCFNLNPAPGTSITRNYAHGPNVVNIVMLRVARTWVIGGKEKPGTAAAGGPRPPAGGGTVMVSGPGGTTVAAPAALVNMGMPGSGAGPRRYNLIVSAQATNPLNHVTYSAPSGDLSSPYFGVYRTLSGGFGPSAGAVFNRRIDVQVRLAF